jgi:hypothetical protein
MNKLETNRSQPVELRVSDVGKADLDHLVCGFAKNVRIETALFSRDWGSRGEEALVRHGRMPSALGFVRCGGVGGGCWFKLTALLCPR